MKVLLGCVLKDPNAQENGRAGQRQNGVDIYGIRDRDASRLVGVQCKQKLDAAVSEKELRAEVEKAKSFRPKLSEFVIATTAGRDQAVQRVAREITQALASTDHPMHVSVWGWEDVEDHALRHEEAVKAFDPTFSPYAEQGFERVETQLRQPQHQRQQRNPQRIHGMRDSPAISPTFWIARSPRCGPRGTS